MLAVAGVLALLAYLGTLARPDRLVLLSLGVLGLVLYSSSASKKEAYDLDHLLLNLPDETAWLNMGYWTVMEREGEGEDDDGAEFARACRRLVLRLAEFAGLKGSSLLEVGCGCGESLPLWVRRFGFERVVGLTSLRAHVERARQSAGGGVEVRQGDAVTAFQGEGEEAKWDAIVAVDCAYHFDTRAAFLLRARELLRPGGLLAMTDLILPRPKHSLPLPTRIVQTVLCLLTSAPYRNFHDLAGYTASLAEAGFVDVEVRDVTGHVFGPLAGYIDRRTREGPDGVVGRANGGSVKGGRWLQYRIFAGVLRWWAGGRMSFVLVRASRPE